MKGTFSIQPRSETPKASKAAGGHHGDPRAHLNKPERLEQDFVGFIEPIADVALHLQHVFDYRDMAKHARKRVWAVIR